MMEEGDRMKIGYSKQIQERINGADDGTIFVNSDFADIADSETTRRNLNRLTQIGMLRRILKGVYEKPKYSKLLDEYVAADPDAVAKALARSYHWTIVPCGNTALNLLGLSTQVTAVWSYISDGPYKTYEWNSTKLEFKHRTNKEITGLSYMTSLVIQALKTLGRINVTAEIIQTLSEKLTEDEKASLSERGDGIYGLGLRYDTENVWGRHTMRNVARLPDSDRGELFRNTADKMSLNDAIVEKDFWICSMVMFLLFTQ